MKDLAQGLLGFDLCEVAFGTATSPQPGPLTARGPNQDLCCHDYCGTASQIGAQTSTGSLATASLAGETDPQALPTPTPRSQHGIRPPRVASTDGMARRQRQKLPCRIASTGHSAWVTTPAMAKCWPQGAALEEAPPTALTRARMVLPNLWAPSHQLQVDSMSELRSKESCCTTRGPSQKTQEGLGVHNMWRASPQRPPQKLQNLPRDAIHHQRCSSSEYQRRRNSSNFKEH